MVFFPICILLKKSNYQSTLQNKNIRQVFSAIPQRQSFPGSVCNLGRFTLVILDGNMKICVLYEGGVHPKLLTLACLCQESYEWVSKSPKVGEECNWRSLSTIILKYTYNKGYYFFILTYCFILIMFKLHKI